MHEAFPVAEVSTSTCERRMRYTGQCPEEVKTGLAHMENTWRHMSQPDRERSLAILLSNRALSKGA
jgi:hypothetical protein